MSIQHLYDYETAIEEAIAEVLTAAGLVAVTPTTPPAQTKPRPRIEVTFQPQAAKRSYHIVNGRRRNASWTGLLKVDVITEMDIAEHREQIATVRDALAEREDIDDLLNYHRLQDIAEQGTDPIYKLDDGYFISTLTFQIDFGIDSEAWAELSN